MTSGREGEGKDGRAVARGRFAVVVFDTHREQFTSACLIVELDAQGGRSSSVGGGLEAAGDRGAAYHGLRKDSAGDDHPDLTTKEDVQ